MFGIGEKSYNMIIEAIGRHPEIEKACVFGSRAMGNYKKGSDVDICIYGKGVTEETVSRLNFELNEMLPIPYFFDIVFYDGIENENLKKHIDNEGKMIELSR